MWEYNYTGSMSDDDCLQHWKYVKKYKKNGKWRYVYDKLGLKEREVYKKSKQKYEKSVNKYYDSRHLAMEYEKRAGVSAKDYDYNHSSYLHRDVSNWKEIMVKNGKEYAENKAKYYKTPVGKITKFVDTGKSWIDSLLR